MMPAGMTFILKAADEGLPVCLDPDWTGEFLGKVVSYAGLRGEALRKRPAPFSISTLMPTDGSRSVRRRNAGPAWEPQPPAERTRFRLRLGWLADADLRGLLDWAKSLRAGPVPVETNGGPLILEDALVSSALTQRWNRWVPYERLYEEATECHRQVTLKFCSPTTLQRSGRPYPLPDPIGIFLGYLKIWNAFSGISLDTGLGQAIEKGLLLVDFRLRKCLSAGGRDVMHGFIGSATFRLSGRHPESILKGLNALADYAFFCGTGIGTDRGMGLTRRILHDEGRM
jgi:CRISPR-associated endoribonuclease Cas6